MKGLSAVRRLQDGDCRVESRNISKTCRRSAEDVQGDKKLPEQDDMARLILLLTCVKNSVNDARCQGIAVGMLKTHGSVREL